MYLIMLVVETCFTLFNTLHNITGLKAGQVTTCISESNESFSLGHACGSLGQMKENGDLV